MRHRVDDGRLALASCLGSRASPRRCRAHAHAARPTVGPIRFVNAGSVGRPHEARPAPTGRSSTTAWSSGHRVTTSSARLPRRGQPATRGPRSLPPRTYSWFPRARKRSPSLVADLVQIGKVGKPHGIAGAFFVEDASEAPERFAVGGTLLVGRSPAKIVESKRSGGRPGIRLDREVERGSVIEIERRRSEQPADGEYYAFELVGLGGAGGREARSSGASPRSPPTRRTTCSSSTRASRFHSSTRASGRSISPQVEFLCSEASRPIPSALSLTIRGGGHDCYLECLHAHPTCVWLAHRAAPACVRARHGARAPPAQLP